jgi:uncharacterized protein HemY
MNTAQMATRSARAAVDEARGIEALYATGYWLLSQDRPADAACVLRAMALVAPADDRSWLALGTCHEALGQPEVALQMYGTGRVLARSSVRCDLARARILRAQGRNDEAERTVVAAADEAEGTLDDALLDLVSAERGRR